MKTQNDIDLIESAAYALEIICAAAILLAVFGMH